MLYIDTRKGCSTIYYSLFHLKKHFNNFDSNKLTWNEEQQSQFIESLLLRFPIQPFYFQEQPRPPLYSIADGLQRLLTIDRFYRGQLSLRGPLLNAEWIGRKFEDLPAQFQNIFEDYILTIYFINPATPQEIVNEIIRRIKN